MKKTAILASMAAVLFFTACGDNTTANTENNTVTTEVLDATESETYAVVPAESELIWNGKKVAGEHSGTINLQDGELLVAGNDVVGGTLTIDMNSITNTDLTDPEYNGQLVGHLKNDDFFSVDKHPTATFKINAVSPIADAAAGQPNYNVEGDLTIKGITKPVSFPATISVENGVANAKADVKVDRTQYDIRYGSTNFFENLGDKAIDNEFTLSFNVTAKK
jgi:polyisoprenoid-binding protein YceI